MKTKADYLQARREVRDNVVAELSASLARTVAVMDAERRDAAEGSPRALFGIPVTSNIADLNIIALGDGWYCRQAQDEDRDWSAYSKAWRCMLLGA